jgi:hypothetical protein
MGHQTLGFELPPLESVIRCHENGPLIAQVASLWIGPDELVVDMTYGEGLFWTHYRPERLVAHDLIVDGVDFRNLTEADGSVDVAVFDPPYVSAGGRSTTTIADFYRRYGLKDAPKTPAALRDYIAAGMAEGARIIRPGGRLMVKTMDYVSSGRMQWGRHHVVETALALGLEQVDEFVHHSGAGAQPKENLDGSPRRQVHSRRAHTFLCVFEKPKPKRARRRA